VQAGTNECRRSVRMRVGGDENEWAGTRMSQQAQKQVGAHETSRWT
jgi:hypothetical protein